MNWFKKQINKYKNSKSLKELSNKVYKDDGRSIIDEETLDSSKEDINSVEKERKGISNFFSKKRKKDSNKLEEINKNLIGDVDSLLKKGRF